MLDCKKKNYTLIEMIVVIAILGILAKIAAPYAVDLLGQKKETKAKEEIMAIVQAIKVYQTEYMKLPFKLTEDYISKSEEPKGNAETFIKALIGGKKNPDKKNNPKASRFLKTKVDDERDPWMDPWGNDYVIGVDYTYDGIVSFYNTKNEGYDNLRGSIFVFSKGENGVSSNDVDEDLIAAGLDLDEDKQISPYEKKKADADNLCSWKKL